MHTFSGVKVKHAIDLNPEKVCLLSMSVNFKKIEVNRHFHKVGLSQSHPMLVLGQSANYLFLGTSTREINTICVYYTVIE